MSLVISIRRSRGVLLEVRVLTPMINEEKVFWARDYPVSKRRQKTSVKSCL